MIRAFLGVVVCMFAVAYPASANVRFSEIAWMGTADSQFAEWIELFNDTDAEIDLSGAVLYEGGGSVLVISLMQKIAPKGFFLIERTTASAPDPVPGLGDVAGSFGGSGLSNGGEFLVLKDKNGTLLDMLDDSGGWRAGDASTRQTMQRAGDIWITATATPRLPNAIAVATTSVAAVTNSSTTTTQDAPSAHSGSTGISPSIDPVDLTVSAGRDRLVVVGAEVEFDARLRGAPASEVDVTWAFGDGGFARGISAVTSYDYPGEYVVVVNATHKGLRAVSRTKVTVIPLDLVLSADSADSRIVLENRSRFELNLGGWRLAAGAQSFVLPRDTIVLPNRTTTFSSRITKFSIASTTRTFLARPDGAVIDVVGNVVEAVKTEELSRIRAMLVEAFARLETLAQAVR